LHSAFSNAFLFIKIQKRKGNEKGFGGETKPKKTPEKEKELEERKEKRKSTEKLTAIKKAAVVAPEKKITESRSETLKRVHCTVFMGGSILMFCLNGLPLAELIAKWDRPLTQLSVHADLPRIVNKVVVINKKTGPPTVWPLTDEMPSSSLHSIRGFVESLHRYASS